MVYARFLYTNDHARYTNDYAGNTDGFPETRTITIKTQTNDSTPLNMQNQKLFLRIE